jgi:hypothetical protein
MKTKRHDVTLGVWVAAAVVMIIATASTPARAYSCSDGLCANGATCVNGSAPVTNFTCTCAGQWVGAYCNETSACSSTPCLNGATCSNTVNGSVHCTCPTGYSGNLCQTNINECASTPCQHGGVCTDGIGNFTCNCTTGYSGRLCQTDTDECASNPCRNGGTCTDHIGNFTCACTTEYVGQMCEVNAGCGRSPFNRITAKGAGVDQFGGGSHVVMTANHIFARSNSSQPRGVAVTKVDTTGALVTAAFGPQQVDSVLFGGEFIDTSEFDALDDFAVTLSRNITGDYALYTYTYSGGVWTNVQSLPLPDPLHPIYQVRVNKHFIIALGSQVRGDATVDTKVYTWSRDNVTTLSPNVTYMGAVNVSTSAVMNTRALALTPGECASQFFAVASLGSYWTYRWNGTSWYDVQPYTSPCTTGSPLVQSLSLTCDMLAGGETQANCVFVANRTALAYDAPTALTVPQRVTGEHCGWSLALTNSSLVVGCPDGVVVHGGVGRVLKWSVGDALHNTSLPTVYRATCNEWFSIGQESQFGANVAVYGNQFVVADPLADNSHGVLYQFTDACASTDADACGRGRTCIESVADAAVTTCVCPFESSDTSAPCIVCDAGTYQANSSVPTCTNCAIGTYADVADSTTCTTCGAGFAQPLEGQTHCLDCDIVDCVGSSSTGGTTFFPHAHQGAIAAFGKLSSPESATILLAGAIAAVVTLPSVASGTLVTLGAL